MLNKVIKKLNLADDSLGDESNDIYKDSKANSNKGFRSKGSSQKGEDRARSIGNRMSKPSNKAK